MEYWHLQMFLPDGQEGDKIDSSLMLHEAQPVIGTGEWDNNQCRNFKNEDGGGLEVNDVVLVREGALILALCRVISPTFRDGDLEERHRNIHFRNIEILGWYTGIDGFPQPRGTLQRLTDTRTDSWLFVNTWHQDILNRLEMESFLCALDYKKQLILQGPPGTGKTRLAKELAFDLISPQNEDVFSNERKLEFLKNHDRFKLVQFHPSYTYEDFIRGIQSKSNSEGQIEFETLNRVLLEMAKEALDDYNRFNESQDKTTIDEFANKVAGDLLEDVNNQKTKISPAIVKSIDEGGMTLSRETYEANAKGFTISFTSLKEEIIFKLTGELDKPRLHPPLHNKLMEALWSVINEYIANPPVFKSEEEEITLKKHVLVIDEINRANLSSVLGELIYALEYRGEPVHSLYKIDGDSEIIIPPNLYIIGTMNTADRSVGSIDYAVRRRFAFKDVLPNREVISLDSGQRLFDKVSAMFDEGSISQEFKKNQVQLGHSYFIADTEDILKLKLETEIKPILHEYINDGILLQSNKEIIDQLVVE